MTIPAPYYSENNTRIYSGDCLDIMKALPSNSVGLVVTDPPYMIGPISTYNQAFWGDMMNSARLYAEWYSECKRLLRHDGALWTFLNWKTVPTLIKAATIAELPILSLMVWDKENRGGGHPAGLRGSYELCALMAKPGFKIANNDLTDVWRYRWSSRHTKDHPAEKPVGLLKRIIAESGTKGIVLDPFMGSGSTLVAARELGFPAVGIEQEEKFCRRAVERLGGQYQQSLLAQPPTPAITVPDLFPNVLPEPLIINEPPETLSEDELRRHVRPVVLNQPVAGQVMKLRFVGAVRLMDGFHDFDREMEAREDLRAYFTRQQRYYILKAWWEAQRTLRKAKTRQSRIEAIRAIQALREHYGDILNEVLPLSDRVWKYRQRALAIECERRPRPGEWEKLWQDTVQLG